MLLLCVRVCDGSVHPQTLSAAAQVDADYLSWDFFSIFLCVPQNSSALLFSSLLLVSCLCCCCSPGFCPSSVITCMPTCVQKTARRKKVGGRRGAKRGIWEKKKKDRWNQRERRSCENEKEELWKCDVLKTFRRGWGGWWKKIKYN